MKFHRTGYDFKMDEQGFFLKVFARAGKKEGSEYMSVYVHIKDKYGGGTYHTEEKKIKRVKSKG